MAAVTTSHIPQPATPLLQQLGRRFVVVDDSNIEAPKFEDRLARAQVVFLCDLHIGTWEGRRFNGELLAALFKEGDTILVETEDGALCEQLDHVPDKVKQMATVRCWDDQREAGFAMEDALATQLGIGQDILRLKKLRETPLFATLAHTVWKRFETEEPLNVTTALGRMATLWVERCATLRERDNHQMREQFGLRQTSLVQQVRVAAGTGRVWVFAGPDHLRYREEEDRAAVDQLKEGMGDLSFLVLHALMEELESPGDLTRLYPTVLPHGDPVEESDTEEELEIDLVEAEAELRDEVDHSVPITAYLELLTRVFNGWHAD
jgi:hypothetical protein